MSSISTSTPPAFTQVPPTPSAKSATPTPAATTAAATPAAAKTVPVPQNFHNTDGTYGPHHQFRKPGATATTEPQTPSDPLSVSLSA